MITNPFKKKKPVKKFFNLTDFVSGPADTKILRSGKFIIGRKDDKPVWLIVGKYCSIAQMEEDIVIDPKHYKVALYVDSGAYVVIDDNWNPYNKNLPEIGKKIHLTVRRGIYEVIKHANGMFAVTCNRWKQDDEEPDERWYYPKQFHCYAGGIHSLHTAESKPELPPEPEVPEAERHYDDLPF